MSRRGGAARGGFIGLDWVFIFKVTEVQPLMGLIGVRQMAAFGSGLQSNQSRLQCSIRLIDSLLTY